MAMKKNHWGILQPNHFDESHYPKDHHLGGSLSADGVKGSGLAH